MYELTNSIPVPQKKSKVKGRTKYPFATMAIGDSFFAPNVKPTSLYQSAHKMSANSDRKFVVRATLENRILGARVWRTK